MADQPANVELCRLVADHHVVLYRYAYRLAGNAADAEDLVQETYLVAQRKWEQIRGADSALGWLCTVLRNLFLKSRNKQSPLAAGDWDLDLQSVPERTPEQPLLDGEQLQLALDELPDEFRIVLLLFYFERLSYRDMAARLSVPLGTVMSRLSRAKNLLRLRLFRTDEPRDRVQKTRNVLPARSP